MTPAPMRLISLNVFSQTERIEINNPFMDAQLEIDMSCTMSISPDANTAMVRIMNLSRKTRESLAGVTRRSLDVSGLIAGQPAVLSSLGGVPAVQATAVERGDCGVEIYGGYTDKPALLFLGTSQWVRHRHEGPTWITEMQVGDGLSTMMEGVASRSFPPGATTFEVVQYLVRVMALGQGNLSEASLAAAIGSQYSTFPFGWTSFGDAKWALTQVLGNTAEWFVDRGEFYVVARGTALPDVPAIVSVDTGMIYSPEPAEFGKIRVRSIMRPDIRIGRKVRVVGPYYEGVYRAEVVTHNANNRGGTATTDVLLSAAPGAF
jgi:hypothetical protein